MIDEKRFQFGQNWKNFLDSLDQERIDHAKKRLTEMLGVQTLEGKSFLDIGSGSGLHSLAARQMGAKVFSFDYDRQSVACTEYLRDCYFQNDPKWHVEPGDALDPAYIKALGKFDVVYSWGVLHHTGQMWRGLENAASAVADGGTLFVAIYNHQVYWSRYWAFVKKTYNASRLMRGFWTAFYLTLFTAKGVIKDLLLRKNPLARYREYKQERGMSIYYDLIDWIGGWPFEVAKPEEIFDFFHTRGFTLERLKTCGGGYGCNEFVFRKTS